MSDGKLPLLLFPDTNVLMHGRPLDALPWRELDVGDLDLVLARMVVSEVDGHKYKGGRLGRTARSWNARIRELMEAPDRTVVIRPGDPRVRLRLPPGLGPRAPVREGLDLADGDDALVNQALSFMDAGEDVLVLTNDTGCALTAEHHGVPVQFLPEHWLRAPEGDEVVRELAAKDREIAHLKAAAPSPELRFVDEAGEPIDGIEKRMARYLPLAEADVERLVGEALAVAPMAKVAPGSRSRAMSAPSRPDEFVGGNVLSFGLSWDEGPYPVTREDVDRYEAAYRRWADRIREKLANFHREWNARREWPGARLMTLNAGSRPATEVLLEVEARGTFELVGRRSGQEGPGDGGSRAATWLALPKPPIPPKPKSRVEDLLASISRAEQAMPVMPVLDIPRPKQRDDDRFYWRAGKHEPERTMSLECKSWRHGRPDDEFPFVVVADDGRDLSGLIVGRVSAGNLATAVETQLRLRVTFEERDTLLMAETLVDEFRLEISGRRKPR